MNTPVTFELAKLLKEKGFDKECTHYYDLEFKECSWFVLDKWCNSEIINGVKELKMNYPVITAPIIAEVVMWLYEKHGIWINVDFKETDESFQYCCKLMYSDDLPRIFCNDGFNSPTKAYEAGIEYTLNNLI